jgi:vacuolar protein sorting-associated protein 3
MVHGVSVFILRLLGLYWDPQNGKEPMFTAAVQLLHIHGKSLDPLEVLEVLLLHQYF